MSTATGFRDLVGLDVHQADEGRSRITLAVAERHLNPHGSVHGGVIATMADVATGEAVKTTHEDNAKAVTVELTVAHLNPGQPGSLTATAQVRRRGRVTVVEAEVSEPGRPARLGVELPARARGSTPSRGSPGPAAGLAADQGR